MLVQVTYQPGNKYQYMLDQVLHLHSTFYKLKKTNIFFSVVYITNLHIVAVVLCIVIDRLYSGFLYSFTHLLQNYNLFNIMIVRLYNSGYMYVLQLFEVLWLWRCTLQRGRNGGTVCACVLCKCTGFCVSNGTPRRAQTGLR